MYTPYQYECKCKCHVPDSTVVHDTPCCKPNPTQQEMILRELLASYAGSPLLYRDDGELQDSEIDFLRDHPIEIAKKLTTRALMKVAAARQRIEIKEFEHVHPCHMETCACSTHVLYLDGVALTDGSRKELEFIERHLRSSLANSSA